MRILVSIPATITLTIMDKRTIYWHSNLLCPFLWLQYFVISHLTTTVKDKFQPQLLAVFNHLWPLTPILVIGKCLFLPLLHSASAAMSSSFTLWIFSTLTVVITFMSVCSVLGNHWKTTKMWSRKPVRNKFLKLFTFKHC